MHYLEREVQKYRRRVKAIRANPDPTKLQANLLLYELSLEQAEHRWRWFEEGRPFAYCDGGPPALMRALGMEVMALAGDADRLGANAAPYLDLGKRYRYHESLCDRVLAGQGLAVSDDYVPPSFVAACNYPCTPHTLAMVSLGQHFQVPTCALDMSDDYSPDTIDYLVEQMQELIEVAEAKVPKVKFDEEKLAREQANEKRGDELLSAVQDLKSHIPSPVSGLDVIRIPRFFYHNPEKSIVYLENYLEEMHDRIAKGIAPVPDEKVRLMWTVSAPLFTENVWNFLHEKDASMVCYDAGGEFGCQESMMEELGFPPVSKLIGRQATPLEEVAGDMARGVWSGRVERRILTTIAVCRRYHLDGIVHFQQSGCPMGQSTAQIMSERIEAELSIPSLLLDGRMLDQEWYNETQVFSQLEEFIDVCVAYKEMRQSQ